MNQEQLTVFRVAGNTFTSAISQINEVVNYENINKDIQLSGFIEGEIELRGKTIPVIALDEKLGFKSQPITNNTKILITNIGENKIGFKVDDVNEVIQFSDVNIENSSKLLDIMQTAEYIKGVAIKDQQLLILIDLHKIQYK